MYYLGHVVHICAEPYKICTAQEHDVLPGPRGTYLRRIPKKMYVLRRNMMYYLGHAVLEYWQANTADIYIRVRKF
jgi:hypothetical protein